MSKATASRALSVDGHPDVSVETREAVRQAAADLGYRASATARALRSGSFRALSVAIPVVERGYLGWWEPALSAARQEAARASYRLVVHLLDPRSSDLGQLLDELADVPTEALILVTPLLTATEESRLQSMRLPVVFIDDLAPHPWASTVCGDNRGGGYLAGEHLVERGCKRIAVVLPRGPLSFAQERLEGFRAALLDAGVPVHEDLIIVSDEPFMSPQTSPGVDALLARGETFDGVFAVIDFLAVTALRSLKRAGRRVPEHVLVVGYDDDRAAWLVDPPLTTVRQPVADYGRTAVALALAAPTGRVGADHLRLPVELVVRASTGS